MLLSNHFTHWHRQGSLADDEIDPMGAESRFKKKPDASSWLRNHELLGTDFRLRASWIYLWTNATIDVQCGLAFLVTRKPLSKIALPAAKLPWSPRCSPRICQPTYTSEWDHGQIDRVVLKGCGRKERITLAWPPKKIPGILPASVHGSELLGAGLQPGRDNMGTSPMTAGLSTRTKAGPGAGRQSSISEFCLILLFFQGSYHRSTTVTMKLLMTECLLQV